MTMWSELRAEVEALSDDSYRNADYREVSAFVAVLARMEQIENARKHDIETNYASIGDWYLIHLYNEYGKIFAEYDKRMKTDKNFLKELADYQQLHSKG